MIEYHDAWLLKAENDLRLAEIAIRQDDLTPKATEYRYPDDFIDICDRSQLFSDLEEVESAIIKAKRIFDFVKSKLADDNKGNPTFTRSPDVP